MINSVEVELNSIRDKLIIKMEQEKYTTSQQQSLRYHCQTNLRLYNQNKEMNIHGVHFFNTFNSESTTLFKQYCNKVKEINEQRIFNEYANLLKKLQEMVATRLARTQQTDYCNMLTAMKMLYSEIETESMKGPEFQTKMIDVITSMIKIVELDDSNIRDYINNVPGNITYVFYPLIPPITTLHITLPLMLVFGFNPALTIGIINICILALIGALILTSICLFVSSQRTGFSAKLVTLCDLYDKAKYEDLNKKVEEQASRLNDTEQQSIKEIQDLIQSQTQSNTTGYSMLYALDRILNATNNNDISLEKFQTLSPTWRFAYLSISSKTCAFFNHSYNKKSNIVREQLHPQAISPTIEN